MLFRHSLIYLVGRSLPGLVNFLAIALFTRLIGPTDFGRYVLIVATAGFVNVSLFWWLRLSMSRFVPKGNGSKLLSTVAHSFGALTLATTVAGIVALALVTVAISAALYVDARSGDGALRAASHQPSSRPTNTLGLSA